MKETVCFNDGKKMMKNISWWRTEFGQEEINNLTEAINNECISQGIITAELEKRLAKELDIPYVVATTSGSMALLMALIALGIKPGDEVIVPNRTWIATAHAPLMLGAKVVLVDVMPDIPIMDISQLKTKITHRTKAIIPVHLGGRAVDMEAVKEIAKEYGLCVIEDAAQALFSRNQDGYLGTQSDVGCFSLSIAKLISTGQGGFIVTKNKETYEKLKLIRTHGVNDVINVSYTRLGFNFRFTDIQASIGIAQLNRLKEKIDRVKAIYARYLSVMHELPFLKFIPVNMEAGEIPLYIEVLCSQRDKIMRFLAEQGIQTRPFYPDLDTAGYFGRFEEFPNARLFGEQGVFLPCGPAQNLENIDYVIDVLRKYQ